VHGQGEAVQVDPIKPTLKALGTKRLQLTYSQLLSKNAFNFNLHRYIKGSGCDLRSSDSYIISKRYFSWMVNAIINGGTVDYDVLPLAPGWGFALRPRSSHCP
jgi:hypothetical protein